jgi:cellulose synthase/poly-beta-1,6-N-acetylglucosamine synthase-like glycosyltransferase
MHAWFAWLWALALAGLSVPVLVVCAEVWMATRAQARGPFGGMRLHPGPDQPAHPGHKCTSDVTPPPTAILIPAHNEAAGIGLTLAPFANRPDWLRLCVVADNCDDDTASLACQAGAEVVERHDPVNRGKGHALHAGMLALAQDPPDVVLVLDADCQTRLADMASLSVACHQAQRPLQAAYLMRAPRDAGLGLRVAEFAWRIKTWVRPLGWRQMGQGGSLLGSGMAFPWQVLQGLPLASGHITEDLSLSFRLAEGNATPLFYPLATVESEFPTGEQAQQAQRTRWEHGHLGILGTEVPSALGAGLFQGQRARLVLALYVLVPPLALLVLVLGAAGMAALLTAVLGGPVWPLLGTALASVALMASLVSAWSRWGRDAMTASDWLHIPRYVWQKLGIYQRWARQPETQWTRTERSAPAAPPTTTPHDPPPNDSAR